MIVRDLGYRLIEQTPVSHGQAIRAICRWNLRMITRQKLFWVLIAIGLLHFLVHYSLIYIKAQITVENQDFAKFLDRYLVTGDGAAYRSFLADQSRAVLLLLAYAGVVLVASDFRAGGISFYLSRPIRTIDYILGKSAALLIILGLLTVVPGLVLFIEYGFFSNSAQYWLDHPRIAVGIVGYSLVIMTVPSVMLLAVGAVCRRGAPLVMVWIAIFLILPAFGELLFDVFRKQEWRYLDTWRTMRIVGQYCFGPYDMPKPWVSLGILAGLLIGSALTLRYKLRAVEIVE